MTPKLYQSDAADAGWLSNSSGARYAGVPTTTSLAPVSAFAACLAMAMPKSSKTARPWVVTMTFDGLMSRCKNPDR